MLPKSTQEEYNRGEYHHPHLYPNQVRKSTKELKLSALYNLAQDHKVNKKDDFILKAEGISFSKAALFLSFHSVQNKQRGAAIQILFRFFPTLAPCQERRTWRTVKGGHPVIIHNGQKKVPQHLSSRTMNKQMVYCFLLLFA